MLQVSQLDFRAGGLCVSFRCTHFCAFFGESKRQGETLAKALGKENFELTTASDLTSAKRHFGSKKFHILILELVKLPGEPLDFLRWVRHQSVVPIIAITSRDSDLTEEMVLTWDADDYVVSPINEKILSNRIVQQVELSKRTTSTPNMLLSHQNLSLDLITHIFLVADVQVTLTATEYLIMQLFMKQPERVFTREQILETIGVGEGPGTDHIINSHISRLRIKVRNNGGPEVITVIRNMGYKFVAEKKSNSFRLVSNEKKAKSFTLIPSHEESDS